MTALRELLAEFKAGFSSNGCDIFLSALLDRMEVIDPAKVERDVHNLADVMFTLDEFRRHADALVVYVCGTEEDR